ncbi:MAG: hypothetical protein IIB95_05505 [Candidatus Marinimicrobia bacterium]|nr:hypothetical protein [Candidatus Neomarinimicrobiota bacterium]
MAKYLRKIFDQSVWIDLKYDDYQRYDWLINSEDIPAEPLVQLRPINKSILSFYLIQDDNSNLDQVLAALGCVLKKLQIDFITIDDSQLTEEKFYVNKSKGRTPDEQVNKEWHYDLTELSGFKLVHLAKLLLDKGDPDVRSKHDLIDFIEASIREHRILLKSCSSEVKKKLQAVSLD